jgi:hypothetical protein
MLCIIFIKQKKKKRKEKLYYILSIQEGNNQTSSIKDKQTKDFDIIQDPNIIQRELFISEIKEFYPAVHIK